MIFFVRQFMGAPQCIQACDVSGAAPNANADYNSENNRKIFRAKSMPNAKRSNFCAVTVCELK
jgi:hypothetical protein